MMICFLCKKQTEKSKYGSPHMYLHKTGEQRYLAGGSDGEGYIEQGYQCATCKSRFIFSSQKVNLAWELRISDETGD